MGQKYLSRSVHLLCITAYNSIEWRYYHLCNYLLTEEHLRHFLFSALLENLYTYMYSAQSIISVGQILKCQTPNHLPRKTVLILTATVFLTTLHFVN